MIRLRVGNLSIREIQGLSHFSYLKNPLKFCPQIQEFPLGVGPQLIPIQVHTLLVLCILRRLCLESVLRLFTKWNLMLRRLDMLKMALFKTETEVSSKPTFSSLDADLAVLEILKKNDAIQVIYPKQGSGNLVGSPTSAVTYTEIKNTAFLDVFS